MKKAIVTLKDGRVFEYQSQYIWGYKDEMNDNRTPFIEIGNYILRKDEISTIEIVELPNKEEEKDNVTTSK